MRGWLSSLISKVRIQLSIFTLVFILVTGLFSWVTGIYNDRAMRGELVKKSQLLASMINVDQLSKLTASDADLDLEEYLTLKEQLALAVQSVPRGRFLYLTGRHSDGNIFFYVDNESIGSEDESPPGQIYDEASDDFREIFVTARSVIEGPFTDRWGTWVTALSPVVDQRTGQVVAVLGLDVSARDWYWDVAARGAIPVALFAVIFIIVSSFFLNKQHVDVTPKPVLKRLLWPLSFCIGIIVAGFVSLLWWQQNFLLRKDIQQTVNIISRRFHQVLQSQSRSLSDIAVNLADDVSFQLVLIEGNGEEIFNAYQPLIAELNRYYGVSWLEFSTPQQSCRMHRKGRETEAQCMVVDETFVPDAGLGLSPFGTLAFKVVKPVVDNGESVGHIIFGKEINEVVRDLVEPGINLAVIIRKDRLSGQNPEALSLVRQSEDGIFSEYFLSYSSLPSSTKQLVNIIDDHVHYSARDEVILDEKTWKVSLVPFYDSSEMPLGDLIIMHDITEQKALFQRVILIFGGTLAILLTTLFSFLFSILRWTDQGILEGERQLLESEKNYRALINGMNETVWVIDFDATILDVNNRASEVLGFSKEELINNKLYLIDKTLKKEHIDFLVGSMPVDKLQTFETAHTTKDGRSFPVEINSSLVFYKGRDAILSIARDITERKRTQEALKESEARFQSVVSNVPGVIFRCKNDEHWTMEFISRRIQDVAGYPADEFVHNTTRSFASIIHKDDVDIVYQAIKNILVEKKTYSVEYRINTADGQIKWVMDSGRGFFNEQDELIYIDGVIFDITQQKMIEEEMTRMRMELEQSKKMAAIGKLSAGVAHEIKNPLSIILLGVEELLKDAGDINSKILSMIKNSAERANRIILDLLNFSRNTELLLHAVNPVKMVSDVVSSVGNSMTFPQNIRIEEMHHVPKGIILDVDPVLMGHVFINIMNNAVDAMKDGGCIRIETGVRCENEKTFLAISISDNGCGIPADIIDRVFEPFMTTKEPGKGTGLGLSLVYNIIERHKGKITVESTVGVGTTFVIVLPCRQQDTGTV